MALLNENQNYIKVDFNNSIINGNNELILQAIIYKNKEERIKEKNREPLFTSFFQNIRAYTDQEIQKNPTQERLNYLQYLRHYSIYIPQMMSYHIGESDFFNLTELQPYLQDLKRMGFQEEWILDPIVIVMKYSLKEKISNEDFIFSKSLFYNRLKETVENPINC